MMRLAAFFRSWTVLIVMLVCASTSPTASAQVAGNQGKRERETPDVEKSLHLGFAFEVSEGQVFEKEIGAALIFRLDSGHDLKISGWTIEIVPKEAPKDDVNQKVEFIWVVTEPYRSSNPRYLDTSYGTTAKEAVAWSPRSFRLVLTMAEYEKVTKALDVILWPYNYSQAEIDKATDTLRTVPTAGGALTILDSRITEAGKDGSMGRILWLKCAVDLSLQCDFSAAPGIELDRSGCTVSSGKPF
jgi:hypothetical protein